VCAQDSSADLVLLCLGRQVSYLRPHRPALCAWPAFDAKAIPETVRWGEPVCARYCVGVCVFARRLRRRAFPLHPRRLTPRRSLRQSRIQSLIPPRKLRHRQLHRLKEHLTARPSRAMLRHLSLEQSPQLSPQPRCQLLRQSRRLSFRQLPRQLIQSPRSLQQTASPSPANEESLIRYACSVLQRCIPILR
jgi:hypothetical protein